MIVWKSLKGCMIAEKVQQMGSQGCGIPSPYCTNGYSLMKDVKMIKRKKGYPMEM